MTEIYKKGAHWNEALATDPFGVDGGPTFHAQQDSGVSLTIRFVDGTNRFHVGEVVPIELLFRASISNTYDMEMRNYDRSGRLNIEQFHVTPPGRDPLQNYYSIGGFMGGGLGGPRELSNEPQIMHEDLNEWVALDQPGHYSPLCDLRTCNSP